MVKKYRNLIICVIAIIALVYSLAMSEQLPNNRIAIESMPKLTKGFPSIIKISIKGPLAVPYITLMDEQIPITVHIISKSDGKEFVIESFRSITEHLMSNREGNQTIGRIVQPPTISVPEGKEYTMLFDLWSILPNLWTDTCLSDVPAGQYSIYIEFNKKNLQLYSSYRVFDSNNQQILEILKSNSIDVELIDPTDQEKQFIKTIQGLGRVNHKVGINWIMVLNKEISIPNDKMSLVTGYAREQIALDKLISDVNIATQEARNKSINDVTIAKLPTFFEPERIPERKQCKKATMWTKPSYNF